MIIPTKKQRKEIYESLHPNGYICSQLTRAYDRMFKADTSWSSMHKAFPEWANALIRIHTMLLSLTLRERHLLICLSSNGKRGVLNALNGAFPKLVRNPCLRAV